MCIVLDVVRCVAEGGSYSLGSVRRNTFVDGEITSFRNVVFEGNTRQALCV